MAANTCPICKKSFSYNKNEENVKNEITSLNNGLDNIFTTTDMKLQKLSDIIPKSYGEMDELGENVDTYIKEISNKLDGDIKEIKSYISENSENIVATATQKDSTKVDSMIAQHKKNEHGN